MADLLIRDVPGEVVVALEARARRLGLSPTEYVRRQIARAATPEAAVTAESLRRFQDSFADLADAGVMRRAWE